MKLHIHRVELPLRYQFTIARGTMRVQNSLIVELEEDGVRGFGESTTHSYYNVTQESLTASMEKCRSTIEHGQFQNPAELWTALQPLLQDDMFALAAIDAAAYDLFGKTAERFTFDLLGLQWRRIPESSYTIGIDTISRMIEKLQERLDWTIFKIKLGTNEDVEIVRQLRQQTDATFRVDANCGWSVEETIENSRSLRELGVEFIEQPLPASASVHEHRKVFENSALPIIADESCLTEADVEKCHGLFHGINVKLSKCGGITPGHRMLLKARKLGMKTMLGCMVESSVGISAAAQLLPLLDYADIDGAELLAADIASGATVVNGSVILPGRFGNGVALHDPMEHACLAGQ
ncbi:dipeptide epimerase [Calycomorphotria hydatis]|uniref:Dipeptide epimerase n=1 Tax=Calycomorphotria hydatis TaxID=2528027 RepID=A0A517T5D8_9PLAN|nr:dipeptide epimerase [Calycomorphotria hydatis]QDT63593.1 L-Ala-D/L-Glu epimerase [Calycomorphotria hydatis]